MMREKLWTYLHEEHGLSLLESELNDIETIVYADLSKLVERWVTYLDKNCGCPECEAIRQCAKEAKELLDGGE